MIILGSWPAFPDDYVKLKNSKDIIKVDKVEDYGIIVVYGDYGDFNYFGPDEYYVLHLIHEEETPLQIIPEIKKLLAL